MDFNKADVEEQGFREKSRRIAKFIFPLGKQRTGDIKLQISQPRRLTSGTGN